VSRALWIPGADRTSRFYGGKYPWSDMPVIEKLLIHSTETPKTSGCPGYYDGSMAPTVTINPWRGHQKIWQHFAINRPARALVNPSSTPVSENRDGVFQVEIIGYSDPALGKKYGCYLPDLADDELDYLAEMLGFVAAEWDVPTTLPPTWPLYKVSSWAAMNAARMTSSEYDRHHGLISHLHASGNSHSDAAINIRALKPKVDAVKARLQNGPTLNRGDTGAPVAELQKMLNATGANLTVDGSFGPGTEAAVKTFQSSHVLPVTGVVDARTLAALKVASTPTPITYKEPTMVFIRVENTRPVFVSNGIERRWVQDPNDFVALQAAIRAEGGKGAVTDIKADQLDAFGGLVGPEPTA
jgi:hypothetical protein